MWKWAKPPRVVSATIALCILMLVVLLVTLPVVKSVGSGEIRE